MPYIDNQFLCMTYIDGFIFRFIFLTDVRTPASGWDDHVTSTQEATNTREEMKDHSNVENNASANQNQISILTTAARSSVKLDYYLRFKQCREDNFHPGSTKVSQSYSFQAMQQLMPIT